ncbi:peptidase c14 caspase catalytic subunit p20 [Colletotrichum musicola]|uniref:Peptidase c14 caspase catalytic subunit p20 n=1 Tax=Colletotrichum musicola TaxID=2175873 RepID=A0A8H6IY84_9PEZI|nr:peptidase c14 caspase catalytic subunit p20 [Colletotrichum musicola]
MASAKRALLIGSSYGGLKGTRNDVDIISRVLSSRGFDVRNSSYVTRLHDEDATRQRILEAWEKLISETSWGDVVVIYYSGHGSLVDSSGRNNPKDPQRIQFLVPTDFDPDFEPWGGIFDGEVSLLLRRTTAKSQNVTYILDCCHAARLGRSPQLAGGSAQPKFLSLCQSDHTVLAKHVERLKREGNYEETHLRTNPHAVRIAASATHETAWEFEKAGVEPVGLMTRNLAMAILDAGSNVSWRDMMLEVASLVETDFPDAKQHPRSAGPDERTPFSTMTTMTGALLASMSSRGYTLIQGGRVNGIREGDQFKLTPFGYKRGQGHRPITPIIATVQTVRGFLTILQNTPTPSELGLGGEKVQALAVPYHRQDTASSTAQNILSLESGLGDEALGAEVEFEMGLEDNWKEQLICRGNPVNIRGGRPIGIKENDRVWFGLKNLGSRNLFVNAFVIDAAGKVSLISKSWEKGRDLCAGGGSHRYADCECPLEGMKASWPDGFLRTDPVTENIVFIVTAEEIDLRDLDSSAVKHLHRGLGDRAGRSGVVPYAVVHVPYLLSPD